MLKYGLIFPFVLFLFSGKLSASSWAPGLGAQTKHIPTFKINTHLPSIGSLERALPSVQNHTWVYDRWEEREPPLHTEKVLYILFFFTLIVNFGTAIYVQESGNPLQLKSRINTKGICGSSPHISVSNMRVN